jgi:hypothetical protein
MASIGSSPADYRPEGPEQQNNIQPKGPSLQIHGIQPDSPTIRNIIPPTHLPQSGQARFGLKNPLKESSISTNLISDDRPWPNQGHVAKDHIQHLRQLIKRGPAQDFPPKSHPWVIFKLIDFFKLGLFVGRIGQPGTKNFVGIIDHGPEFEEMKNPTPNSNSLLPVNRGFRLKKPQNQPNEKNQRAHQRGSHPNDHQVEKTFQSSIVVVKKRAFQNHLFGKHILGSWTASERDYTRFSPDQPDNSGGLHLLV